MCQPRKWLWGLLPLFLLGILAGYWQQADMETELTRRSTAALSAAGLGWGKVAISGRDAILSGEAPSPEAKAVALKTIMAQDGIRRASDATTVLAEAKPFTFTAMRDGAKITLSGHVPTAAARDALGEAARKAVAGAVVVDETRLARGASQEFQSLAAYGLGQLARLSQGTLQLSDQVLSLSGRAADFDAFSAVRAGLSTLPGGAKLGKGLGAGDILPPLMKPFIFEALREGNIITLSGYVPSAEIRQKLLADLKAAGLTVKDTMRVADGAPVGDWAGFATGGLGALGKLTLGKLSISDEKLSLSGKAREGVTLDALKAGLASLPSGFGLGQLNIEEAPKPAPKEEVSNLPFSFEALRGEKTLSLKGVVGDEKARADLLALAGRLFEGDKIDANLALGAVPREAGSLMAGGLQLLSRLGPGAKLNIDTGTIGLSGLALFDVARNAIAEDFKRLVPASYAGNAEIGTAQLAGPVSPAECQTLFQEILASGTVRFRVASASLNEESRGILDKLTAVALRCGEARVEIGGHTDSDGAPPENAELSRRRAETVALYFTQAGIPAARLEPVGYGETKPVAPNDTAENKARNRRIEFLVK
ncbi:MAG: OmpA family protein [Proteobacteria bacterium]|nr:OmpA family protein [Pseudomonadota bacterium]